MAVEDELLEIAEVELALTSLRRLHNAFAHTAEEIHLADPAMCQRLAEATRSARHNPLWAPLEAVLRDHDPEQDPALIDYILLITILVAFLETAARTLTPLRPALVMSFQRGIGPPAAAQ